MRKLVLVLGAAAAVAAAAGCGASSSKAVAEVGKTTITRQQLEQTIEHFRTEARHEGKVFAPDAVATRKQLLGLLVYRARLQEGAAALGISVSANAVERRLETSGGAESGDRDARAFVASSVRAQLLVEAVYRKLAQRVRVRDPQAEQAARNAALERWLASLPSRYPMHRPG